jgi:hypothetical protein
VVTAEAAALQRVPGSGLLERIVTPFGGGRPTGRVHLSRANRMTLLCCAPGSAGPGALISVMAFTTSSMRWQYRRGGASWRGPALKQALADFQNVKRRMEVRGGGATRRRAPSPCTTTGPPPEALATTIDGLRRH